MMNPNHNDETTPSPDDPPRQNGGFTIDARKLFMFVGLRGQSYEEWEGILRRMPSSCLPGFEVRIMTGDDGELALSNDLAYYCAFLAASDLVGAIALILIKEGREESRRGDLEYTNRMLEVYKVLAMAQGWMSAEHLHSFLQVEEPFDRWLAGLKEKHGMVYGSDYLRVNLGTKSAPKPYRRDGGKGGLFFGPGFAMKIAAAEPTRRGKMVRERSTKSGARWT